jgi:hypothetical protein
MYSDIKPEILEPTQILPTLSSLLFDHLSYPVDSIILLPGFI